MPGQPSHARQTLDALPAADATAPRHAMRPAAGKPLFGTLIALLRRGTPVLGIIDQPILRERWLGVAGRASTLNGAPISTRACPSVGDAYLYATTPHMFAPGAAEQAFNRVRDAGACACCSQGGPATTSAGLRCGRRSGLSCRRGEALHWAEACCCCRRSLLHAAPPCLLPQCASPCTAVTVTHMACWPPGELADTGRRCGAWSHLQR